MTYSDTHETMYQHMISEMLQHGGFQDGVRNILITIQKTDDLSRDDADTVDNLYSIYAGFGVIDD